MPRTSNQVLDAGPATLPPWTEELFPADTTRAWEKRSHSVELRGRSNPHFALIEARVDDAAELGDRDFTAAVEAAYARIARELAPLPARLPVRFWNYIPDIHRRNPDGLDRYMVFNAARQAAYRRWYRDDMPGGNIPTASALDAGRPELIVHALAAAQAGRSFENPRQTPAYRYSNRYGPQPPCFARATAVPSEIPGAQRLMIGGTASIVGEESRHPGDLQAQLDETADNLASLLHAVQSEDPSTRTTDPAEMLRELRAYIVRREDRDAVIADLTQRFPGCQRLEVMRAQLCRRPLLVEIEGLALCQTALPDAGPPLDDAARSPSDAVRRS